MSEHEADMGSAVMTSSLASPATWRDPRDGLDANAVALFLDVDGTLLDFADRPDLVEVPAGLVAALARIERKLGGALALISGRAIV